MSATPLSGGPAPGADSSGANDSPGANDPPGAKLSGVSGFAWSVTALSLSEAEDISIVRHVLKPLAMDRRLSRAWLLTGAACLSPAVAWAQTEPDAAAPPAAPGAGEPAEAPVPAPPQLPVSPPPWPAPGPAPSESGGPDDT